MNYIELENKKIEYTIIKKENWLITISEEKIRVYNTKGKNDIDIIYNIDNLELISDKKLELIPRYNKHLDLNNVFTNLKTKVKVQEYKYTNFKRELHNYNNKKSNIEQLLAWHYITSEKAYIAGEL